jgi:N-acetyl-gamma-glutamyl-phosphate reductase
LWELPGTQGTLLLRHPSVRITSLTAKIDSAQHIASIFPKFKNRLDLMVTLPDVAAIAKSCEVVFLALPHTVSMELVPKLLKAGLRVIDLSADYRLADTAVYAKHYHCAHKDSANIAKGVYGLPELYRQMIKKTKLLANPGCYPTAAILSLAPLMACAAKGLEVDSVIIDAKSGVTGAGRKLAEGFLFCECNEDFKAYRVNAHQHAPEIDQEVSKLAGKKLSVTFVPHLLPVNRGILETIYVKKNHRGTKSQATSHKIHELYKKFYKTEPFVRIKDEGQFPRLRDVVGTNYCDIGIHEEAGQVIIIAAIDNLLKGASGQAVQNMNIMFGFAEQTGLC